MDRPEYPLKLTVNGRPITRVLIDQHYKEKHTELTDPLILDLVLELNGKFFDVEAVRGDFEYFRAEPVVLANKPYRVIFLLCIGEDFLGVVNAFRVKE